MSDALQTERQAIVDGEQLKLLAIFYYVIGGMTILMSCFALFYVMFGLVIWLGPESTAKGKNPREFGAVIAAIGGTVLLLGWTLGLLTVFAGRSVQLRKRRLLTLIVAGLQCPFFPYGTILGVFTFIVLLRGSVRELYEPLSGVEGSLR